MNHGSILPAASRRQADCKESVTAIDAAGAAGGSYNRAVRWFRYIAAALTVMAVVACCAWLSVATAGPAAPLLFLNVVVAARLWGTGPALRRRGLRAGAYSYYFLPPAGFGIEDPEDWIAFITFTVTAVDRRGAGVARRAASRRSAGRAPGDRAALSGAADRVRTRQRGRGGAPQRTAQGGAARRAAPQPADAAHRHQGGGDGADPRRSVAPVSSSRSTSGASCCR